MQGAGTSLIESECVSARRRRVPFGEEEKPGVRVRRLGKVIFGAHLTGVTKGIGGMSDLMAIGTNWKLADRRKAAVM